MQGAFRKVAFGGVLYAALFVSCTLYLNFTTTLIPGLLSFAALAVNFATTGVTSLLSVPFIEFIGMRLSLAISIASVACVLLVCCIGVGWLCLAAAPLMGFAFAVLYNIQSSFCARHGTEATMGRIWGVFWTFVHAGTVASNLLVASLTSHGFELRTVFAGASVWLAVPFAMCFCLPVPRMPLRHATKLSQAVCDAGRRAAGIVCLLQNREVQLLAPMLVIIGTFGSFYAARLNPLMGAATAGTVWAVQTILRTLLTFPCGWLADTFSGALLTCVAWVLYLAMNACIFFFFEVNKHWLFIFAFVVYSFGDTLLWSAVLSPLLSRDFDDVEGVFGLYRSMWPVGEIVSLLVSPLLSVRVFDIIHAGLLSIAFGSLLAYCVVQDRARRQLKPIETVVEMTEVFA